MSRTFLIIIVLSFNFALARQTEKKEESISIKAIEQIYLSANLGMSCELATYTIHSVIEDPTHDWYDGIISHISLEPDSFYSEIIQPLLDGQSFVSMNTNLNGYCQSGTLNYNGLNGGVLFTCPEGDTFSSILPETYMYSTLSFKKIDSNCQMEIRNFFQHVSAPTNIIMEN